MICNCVNKGSDTCACTARSTVTTITRHGLAGADRDLAAVDQERGARSPQAAALPVRPRPVPAGRRRRAVLQRGGGGPEAAAGRVRSAQQDDARLPVPPPGQRRCVGGAHRPRPRQSRQRGARAAGDQGRRTAGAGAAGGTAARTVTAGPARARTARPALSALPAQRTVRSDRAAAGADGDRAAVAGATGKGPADAGDGADGLRVPVCLLRLRRADRSGAGRAGGRARALVGVRRPR